jgi:hypothetical protein
MRKTLSTLAAICLTLHSFAQTYPSAFAWPAAAGKDQKEQGPCHIFASVSAIETWYDILFGAVPYYGISQTHPYSFCGNATQFPSTTIPDCLNFFMNIGGVDLHQLPYASGTPCTVGDNGTSTAYFANQIKSGSSALVNGDCGTPNLNCSPGAGAPTCRYRVANYSVLNIGAYTSNDQLKHAIMNYGPIALWMMTPALYSNTSHAYCLYGWDANGNWLLTDSWPGLPDQGVMKTRLNIDSIFQSGTFAAYILQNTTSHPAVYRQTYNGATWSDDPNTSTSTIGCIPAVSNAFAISGPSTITLSGVTLSVTNIGLLDNPTVSWSYTSTDGSSVGFSPSTGSTTTAAAGSTGTGTIIASIRRPNGLCEQIKMTNVAVHASNIPFTLNQTENLCSGTTRSIQYVASSNYPLTCTWTLYPPGTNPPYTIINGCTFTMDFPQTPSSFGIHVAVTSSALPGAADGATTGGPAMSCTGHMSTDSQMVTRTDPTLTGPTSVDIAILPNPATGLLTIQLPFDRTYEVRIVNTLGATMQIRHNARSSIPIDVSHLARGIYFVQIIDKTKGTLTVKKVQLE